MSTVFAGYNGPNPLVSQSAVNPVVKYQQVRLLQTLRADPPGYPTDNRWVQSSKYQGLIYIAIRSIQNWLGASTIQVLQKRKPTRRKAMGLQSDKETEKWVPADPDECPAVELFERLNAVDTFPEFMAKWTIQSELTGNTLIWTPRNRMQRPAEMWILPTALMTYLPLSPAFPYGAWQYQPWYGINMPFGLYGGTAILPAEDVLHYRFTHPLASWDGFSPLTGMAKELDSYDSITSSRESSFAKGVRPDLLVALKNGQNNQEAQRISDALTNSHGGPQNMGKILSYNTEDLEFQMLNQSPKEMDFPASWEQAVKASIAAFGVPPAIAGLTEAPAYAAYYASLKQFFSNKLAPCVRMMAAFMTKHLIHPNYGTDYRIQIDLPTIDDQQISEGQIAADTQSGLRTVNELRAARGYDLLPGGDVPMAIYMARLQAKEQPAPQMGGAPEQGQDAAAGAQSVPQLGGGWKPDSENGPTPPKSGMGKGSLPPRMVGKSLPDRISIAKRLQERALSKLG